MSITITITDLQTIVDRVRPCVGVDQLLPVFTGVRLYTAGGHLCAIATDRYSVMVTRGPAVSEEFDALVPLTALAKIISTFRKDKKSPGEIKLETNGKQLVASSGEGVFINLSGGSLIFDLINGEFPKINHVVTDAIAGVGVPDLTALAAGMLGRVPKSLASEPCELRGTEPGKPIAVVGRDWVLVLMPLRHIERFEGTWNEWLPAGGTKSAAKAA